MNIFITLIAVILFHVSDTDAVKDAPQYVPVPLDYEERGIYSSSNFVKRGGWDVVSPESKPFVEFVTPSRTNMLGPRTNEWFDSAYLRLTPDVSGKVRPGVVQPLGDELPFTARAGDVFRVGLNLRCEKPDCANVVVQLRDVASGQSLVESAEIVVKETRRHFVDLVIPATHDSDSPISLAVLAVSGSHTSGDNDPAGAVDVDQISVAKVLPDEKGFVSLFNGETLEGWTGNLAGYGVEDGSIRTYPERAGGNIYTEDEFDDFILRFRFKLEPGANNGIGIRSPLNGDAAFEGMEVQVLENSDPKYSGLKNWQFHGSVYGLGPALRGYQRPAGEWNDQEIRAEGRRIVVILNGKVINDMDLDEALKDGTLSGQPHPGALRLGGHIAFCGHGDRVAYKDLRIHRLSEQKNDNSTIDQR